MSDGNVGELRDKLVRELNRITKWRKILAGWQLGTRSDTDAEAAAVRDQRELLILLRIEVNSLANLLIEQGVISRADYFEHQLKESKTLDEGLMRRFPGFKAMEYGMSIDPKVAAVTMKDWKP